MSFDTDFSGLKKLNDEMDKIKKSATGGVDDALGKVSDTIDDIKDSVDKVGKASGLDKFKKAVKGVTDTVKAAGTKVKETTAKLKDFAKTSFTKLTTNLKKIGTYLTDIGKKAIGTAYTGLKKVAGISFKALTVGLGAAATAIGAIVAKSVTSYADAEQLIGGVETLFKGSAGTVRKYADNAYKTAGLSANQYMETVTSFSASLLQSLGGDTDKAASYANMAIVDMSDNANKMGTSMDSIIETYQSLAKGNYAMLDNLKLGYGGTKTEMQRLIKDAAKLDKSVKANDLSYGNLVKAIHAVQENMGISGTTAKEASSTITGSLAAVKSAWGNLLTAMVSGDNLDECINNMVTSVETFGKNIMPAIEKALIGVGSMVEKLAPIIAAKLPDVVKRILPPLINASGTLISALIKELPTIVKASIPAIMDAALQIANAVYKGITGKEMSTDLFEGLKTKIEEIIPTLKKLVPVALGAVGAFKGLQIIMGLFGGGSGKGGGGFGNFIKTIKNLAKVKPTVILKGMGNLAIIIAGFTAIGAAFALVAPYIAQLSDIKSFAELVLVVGVLGVLSYALAKLAEPIGKIPVMTVVKGLANMAIVLGGFTALAAVFMLVTPYITKLADTGSFLKLAGIITVLGIVGAVLSVFAGIVGMIPIPVVLAGLANIALVLGGISAIVVAFGALSKIEGFQEFIVTGGNLLAKLFNVLGKIVGSAIGGLGEGLTASLPEIGKNLSEFAESLKPLFTMFKGVDMAGVGSFFSALGGFMLKIAGEKILSFFTGGTDFSGVAKGLGSLTGEGVKNFFAMVKGIEPVAFENAKAFFECLDGISKLPNVGGIGQIFSGENDYTGVASGLRTLTGDGVKNFFAMVAGIEAIAFENAESFFNCLDGISKLPNVGGIGQIFTGENDFSGVAKGLKALSGKGVKNFFAMVAKLDSSTFTKTSELFSALSDMGEIGKEGFFESIGKLFGGKKDEKSPLSAVADGLSAFATKAKTFFTQVNELKLSNLNGLWESLKKSESVTANVSKIVDEHISDIVKKISELPKKMGDGIKSGGKTLAESLVEIWEDAVKASAVPVNKVIDGANWILKQFGSEKQIVSWEPYAKGTDGHKGGNALVNDGRGAELVQMPNGNTFIPNGRNVFLPFAPRGMKVLSAEKTARLMGKNTPTFRYADGTGDIDVWNYIDNAKGLIKRVVDKFVDYDGLSGYTLNASKSMVSTVSNEMPAWAEKLYDEIGSLASYDASQGVEQWRATVIRALKMEGQYSAANVARTLYQMQTESGGNPKAINLWDSNAKRGIPSKGLMQVIDPTFKAYARKGFNSNIYDPLSNILASVRYATARYGSLSKAYRGVGYSNGVGTVSLPTQSPSLNVSYTPERDSHHYSSSTVEYNTYSPQFHLTISGTGDDRTLARKVKRWISEALDETFDSMNSKNPKLQEV